MLFKDREFCPVNDRNGARCPDLLSIIVWVRPRTFSSWGESAPLSTNAMGREFSAVHECHAATGFEVDGLRGPNELWTVWGLEFKWNWN